MKKLFIFLYTFIFILSLNFISFSNTTWPNNVSISSGSGIVIDKKSGTILYGKNINETFYPASITKLLTALIVLEKCDLNETITFSHSAVFNVESGSSSAGYDVGDKITIKDALYALLLKSANEVANALAEYVSGSNEEFAILMNEKAKELGAKNSNFSNPSGLNDENHYTTAYDFAMIAKNAFNNTTLLEIANKTYYKLPPSIRNIEGLDIYTHHAMLKKNNSNYYKYALGGKTGYTSLAGNTLVTYAKKNNLELITVILGSNKTHYIDTRTLLDFGFDNFTSISCKDTNFDYNFILDSFSLIGNKSNLKDLISVSDDNYLCLPKNANINDITLTTSYKLDSNTKELAQLSYTYENHTVGFSPLISNNYIGNNNIIRIQEVKEKRKFNFYIIFFILILLLLFFIIYFLLFKKRKRKTFNFDKKRKRRKKKFLKTYITDRRLK